MGIDFDEDRNHPEDSHPYRWDEFHDPDYLPDHWTLEEDYEYQPSGLVRVDQVRFGHKRSMYSENHWTPYFTIGVQTFSLQEVETEERAKWYIEMLKIAFNKLTIL